MHNYSDFLALLAIYAYIHTCIHALNYLDNLIELSFSCIVHFKFKKLQFLMRP